MNIPIKPARYRVLTSAGSSRDPGTPVVGLVDVVAFLSIPASLGFGVRGSCHASAESGEGKREALVDFLVTGEVVEVGVGVGGCERL